MKPTPDEITLQQLKEQASKDPRMKNMIFRLGRQSWIVSTTNTHDDIVNAFEQAKSWLQDPHPTALMGFCGVIYWNLKFYLLFEGRGAESKDVFIGREVIKLDTVPHETNGRIAGAIYYHEDNFPKTFCLKEKQIKKMAYELNDRKLEDVLQQNKN